MTFLLSDIWFLVYVFVFVSFDIVFVLQLDLISVFASVPKGCSLILFGNISGNYRLAFEVAFFTALLGLGLLRTFLFVIERVTMCVLGLYSMVVWSKFRIGVRS